MVCHVSIFFSSGGEEVADFHKFPEKRLSPVHMYVCMYVYMYVYMSIRLYTEIREFQDLTVERP